MSYYVSEINVHENGVDRPEPGVYYKSEEGYTHCAVGPCESTKEAQKLCQILGELDNLATRHRLKLVEELKGLVK